MHFVRPKKEMAYMCEWLLYYLPINCFTKYHIRFTNRPQLLKRWVTL